MTVRPPRIVDAHVHLWDPARADWYPYLSGRRQLELGEVDGMARRFDVATYRAESSGWNVVKIVNVAAATGVHSVDEALALDAAAATSPDAAGQPAAIVGGITPTAGVHEVIRQIDRQMAAPRFRGVRAMGAPGHPVPPEPVLSDLAERGLVFDLMAHGDELESCADALAAVDDLVVVVEHCGWPRSTEDGELARWQDGLRSLAELGDRVHCKLSGLVMPLGTMEADVLGPWVRFAIDTFGVQRCLFASNFPVDGLHGTFDQLYSAYDAITSDLSESDRDQLFAANAERVYRC